MRGPVTFKQKAAGHVTPAAGPSERHSGGLFTQVEPI